MARHPNQKVGYGRPFGGRDTKGKSPAQVQEGSQEAAVKALEAVMKSRPLKPPKLSGWGR